MKVGGQNVVIEFDAYVSKFIYTSIYVLLLQMWGIDVNHLPFCFDHRSNFSTWACLLPFLAKRPNWMRLLFRATFKFIILVTPNGLFQCDKEMEHSFTFRVHQTFCVKKTRMFRKDSYISIRNNVLMVSASMFISGIQRKLAFYWSRL